MRIISKSVEETRALGRRIAAQLRPGDVLLLEGDLGAGKSELARGIAGGLGGEGRWSKTLRPARGVRRPSPVPLAPPFEPHPPPPLPPVFFALGPKFCVFFWVNNEKKFF